MNPNKKKSGKQVFRKFIGKVHLVLGLISGTIVCFLAITGCLLAFQREIEDATQSYRFVAESSEPMAPPASLAVSAREALPGKLLHSITYGKGKTAIASFYHRDPEYYYLVFLDPYTGNVLKVKDMSCDFFRVVITGHFYLWLPPDIGQPIVASSTLVFCIMLITGIILWWPRNKAAVKQRFKVKWQATKKRLNYDLHNVFGFYASFVAIIIAATGLVWGFKWFSHSVYFVASGGEQMTEYTTPVSDSLATRQLPMSGAIDYLWQLHLPALKNKGTTVEVHFPDNHTEPIELAVNPKSGTYWKTDYVFYDQYTLRPIPVKHPYGRFQEARAADKLIRMNYDIHVGAIAGIPGKILVFLVSLVCASLPVTGFLVWRGRKRKKRS